MKNVEDECLRLSYLFSDSSKRLIMAQGTKQQQGMEIIESNISKTLVILC